MEVDFGIDLAEVRGVIDAADVLVVRFAVTDRRLLVDARTNETQGPMIKVVPRAGSAQERFKSVKVLRPRFRVPDRIMTFHWPRHARALSESGIWVHLTQRLVAMGWPETAAECEGAYRDLVEEDRRAEVAAVLGGEGFHTLWDGTDRT